MELTHNEIESIANLIAQQVEASVLAKASPGRWLTLKEAMRYAKVKSRDTIHRWIDEGYIYAFKRSGEWIIDRESIDDWYNSDR